MENVETRGKEAFAAIEVALKELKIPFQKSYCGKVCRLIVEGEDVVMPVNLWVEPEYSLVVIGSVLPFSVKKEKAEDMAVILNELNSRIINGVFYLDADDRFVKFKIVDSYLGAPVEKEAIRFHIELLLETVDKYNDKLLAFNNGEVDKVYFTTCI